MKTTMTVLLLLLVLAGFQDTFAKSGGLQKGDKEISGSFNFSHDRLSSKYSNNPSTASQLNLNAFGGVFINDRVQLGGSITLQGLFNNSTDVVALGLGPNIIFNFSTQSTLIPFIDLSVMVITYGGDLSDADTDFILPGIRCGFRSMIGNSAAANFGLSYTRMANPGNYSNRTLNSFGMFMGFSVFP